jgi:hypothetical protein
MGGESAVDNDGFAMARRTGVIASTAGTLIATGMTIDTFSTTASCKFSPHAFDES